MKNKYALRYAVKKDIPELILLLKQLFEIEKDFSFVPENHSYGLALLLESERALILTVTFEGRIIGMCTLQWIVSTAEGGYSGWVEDVVVHESFRRKGVGSRLMKYLIDEAMRRDLVRLQLLVDETNFSAEVFYSGGGWKKTRMRALKTLLKKTG